MSANNASENAAEKANWLWYPYIPYGKITLLQGGAGEGKTTLMLRLAAMFSRGEQMPGDEGPREPAVVLYQAGKGKLEDTLKAQLSSAGADATKIKSIDETTPLTIFDVDRIERHILETGARVFVLDPVSAYLGGFMFGRADKERNALAALERISDKRKCAIIMLRTLTHSRKDFDTIYAAASSVLAVRKMNAKVPRQMLIQLIQEQSPLNVKGGALAFQFYS